MRERILFALALLPLCGGAFLFGVEISNAGRVPRGVTLATVRVGGTPLTEIRTTLKGVFQKFEASAIPITVEDVNTTFSLTPKELGMTIAREETFIKLTAVGRNRNVTAGLWEQVRALFMKPTVAPVVTIDQSRLSEAFTRALASVDAPALNAKLEYNAERDMFTVTQDSSGLVVDRIALTPLLRAHATALSHSEIKISRVFQAPIVSKEEAIDAIPRAKKILARTPLKLIADKKGFSLERKELAELLHVERTAESHALVVTVDPIKTQKYLEKNIAPRVNQEAQDAKFKVEKNRVAAFALSKPGLTLEIEPSVLGMREGLREDRTEINLGVALTEPEVKTEDIDTLGIVGLVGRGETDFKGSPKNRIHNIRTGAARFNGALLKAGEEFSFAKFLGEVTEEAGYKPELVILQGKTTPQLGGGLCQVSTTAFRAAVESGFPITERKAHAYIVRYYGTPGFDATIYPPHPDFRFINNTDGYLLIQTKVEGTTLIFEYYGRPDSRKVEILGPKVYDQKADGSAKATLTVTTTMPDGTVNTQTFNSAYKSPALYPVERRNPLE